MPEDENFFDFVCKKKELHYLALIYGGKATCVLSKGKKPLALIA
jgi:hypothetical protein